MKWLNALAGCLLLSTLAMAGPATNPSTRPADESSINGDVEDAVTDLGATKKKTTTYPSPAELIKQMKAKEAEKKLLLKVAYFDLDERCAKRRRSFRG